MHNIKNIRNFSIIAHIDHGKSTLSDRLIEVCGGLSQREMSEQILDSMDIERERGITIKAQAVTLDYHKDGEAYQLNFIDTPGHVDFSYEVSRSLSACEGALLVVDGSQGVEAQTLANCYTAVDQNLEVLAVINKIDLPQSEPDRVKQEIEDMIGIDASNAPLVSAKTGEGIRELLDLLVDRIPPPKGDPDADFEALIIDSWFDAYLGVVSLIKVINGSIKQGQKIKVYTTQQSYLADQIGIFTPKKLSKKELGVGQVGYMVAGIKNILGAPVGDTIIDSKNNSSKPLPGFKKVLPKVFASLFTVDSDDYEKFRDALSKLVLNDSALVYEPEVSDALGFGFRCGFLGTLHLEVVRERLEREYDLNLISTAPSVQYQVVKTDGEVIDCDSPSQLPSLNHVSEIREPYVLATILTPKDYVGNVITLCTQKRGTQKDMTYFGNQVSIVFEMPLAEVIIDFFDRLKSTTKGYASIEYNIINFYKIHLLYQLEYEEILYLDMDVIPVTKLNFFDEWDLSKGIAIMSGTAESQKSIDTDTRELLYLKYRTNSVRSPIAKYWNTRAMLTERGFDSLNASIATLESAIDDLGIPQMITDINDMNLLVGELIADIEEYSAQMEEFNAKVLEIQASLDAMLITVQGITEQVQGMTVTAGGLATTEQMQNLLSQVQEFQTGVDQLVAVADYDVDGVINALDKCPDTELGVAVDADGCSDKQKED